MSSSRVLLPHPSRAYKSPAVPCSYRCLLPFSTPAATPPPRARAQTCQLALDLMAWRRKQGKAGRAPGSRKAGNEADKNPYLSIDPAPSCGEGTEPDEFDKDTGIDEMSRRLRDQDRTLFERYRYSG